MSSENIRVNSRNSRRTVLFVLLVLGLVALHQDFWWWNDSRRIGGLLPIGLAYHVAYSVLASLLMGCLVKFAWPEDQEAPQEKESANNANKRE